MLQKNSRLVLIGVVLLALMLTIVFGILASRPAPPPSPTVDVGQVQTQAVRVFANGLTVTAAAVPTGTTAATDTPEPPTGTAVEAAGTASTSSVSPTPSCYRLKFVKDLTIPDYTVMTAAQVFTKSWQVQNTGTCPWQPGFQVVLVGGVAMGGSPFKLAATANPGSLLEVSIKMAAPTNQTGLVQGTWRMVDASGNQFGNVMTVNIVIPGGAETPVLTATP
jgi:hypothetical protein